MNNKKYHIITIGCQMNKSDSERIAFYLEKIGYTSVADINEASLVVLTTCGVRQSAEDRIYGFIPKIKKNNTKTRIVLTGCLSDREDVRKRVAGQVDICLNIKELPKLQSMLDGLTDNTIQRDCDYLKETPKYESKISAFVPIGNGCDNFCSYCVVPYARGREVYREPEEILQEASNLIQQGYKEIILIAQNVNSYHNENRSVDFPDLLKSVDSLDGDFWLRFATSHPKDMSDKLIDVMFQSKNLCHHLHLPAQSGDDEILSSMNRKYKIAEYKNLIAKIKNKIPDLAISTDIIVGYPGETLAQFENTKKLFEEMSYDMAYIAQYSPRPKTLAAKMIDNVSKDEKKRREDELMKILRRTSLENNKKYINKKIEVLVEFKNSKGEWLGKSKTAKTVKIKNCSENRSLSGSVVNVLIDEVRDFGMKGNIV